MVNYLLPLLQLCDSNFPNGAFSHSFGIETYIQDNLVHDKDSFFKWLKVYIGEQLAYSDGLACYLTFEALEEGRLEDIWKLDHLIIAQIIAEESRQGSIKIGERLLNLGYKLYPSLPLSTYMERVLKRESHSHPAIVFSMIAYSLNIPKLETVSSYLCSTATAFIQNGVRGIPLGQTEGQVLIKESQDLIEQVLTKIQGLSVEDFGITSPGIEISQMMHERLHVRIFMS